MQFKEFITEQKNTHMTHLEDLVIYGGVKGTRQAIFALRDLRDMLGGKKKSKISVKWDGAPAIFCGQDPTDGEFFVAKKGIFAKNPKIYKTAGEIDAEMSGDLASKMKDALQYVPELGIKGIIQGDFLYSKEDLTRKKIDGVDYVIFHPNTIAYAVPVEQAKPILQAKIGIVWHTTYTGNTFESLKASYGVDMKKLKSSKNVWSQDAMLTDASGATMTAKETEEVNKHLSTCGILFNKVSGTTLREIEGNPELARLLEQYNNTFVRKGELNPPSIKHVNGLIKWIETKFQKEIDKRKSAKGKDAQQKKLDDILKFFSVDNRKSLINIYELQKSIVMAKLILINKLNRLKKIDTFVKTPNGYKVTGEEGYVAIDAIGGDAVKLVDRMEFSYNNFSPDTIKGWDKPTRN